MFVYIPVASARPRRHVPTKKMWITCIVHILLTASHGADTAFAMKLMLQENVRLSFVLQ
jgi:hypothetical protein